MDLDAINEKFKKGFKRYVLKCILNSKDGELFISYVGHPELDRILEGLCETVYFRDYCFDDFQITHIDIKEGVITTTPATVFDNLPSIKMKRK